MLLRENEHGMFSEYEPYTTIVVETEEDFKQLQEAIEKQIPKKPTKHNEDIIGRFYCCPTCSNMEISDFLDFYCWNCGQKLDWSEEECDSETTSCYLSV